MVNKANNMNQSLFNKTIKKEEGVKMCKGKQEGADEWSLSRISRDLCRFSITAFNQVHSMQCSNLSWPFKKGGGGGEWFTPDECILFLFHHQTLARGYLFVSPAWLWQPSVTPTNYLVLSLFLFWMRGGKSLWFNIKHDTIISISLFL